MSNKHQIIELFIDLLPNQPRNDETREEFRQVLRQRFEENLPEAVERIWELPPIILKEPVGMYKELLVEARELFLAGYFYSCVAMCGIVGERIIKDVLRASVQVTKDGETKHPKDVAFDQLERIDVSSIVRFLKEAGLLNDETAKAADSLGQLRNGYVHARGKEPKADAIKAIKLLHAIIEGTVSVFKDFEIKDGVLFKKINTLK